MPELIRIPALENLLEKDHCFLTKSGTVSIWLILEALSFQERMIIVPANSCFVITCAILLSGNIPYYVDIDESCSINPLLLEAIDDERVGAIIYPYMYGNAGDIVRIKAIADAKGWVFIEDIAQALGAKVGDRYAGSFGDIAIVSFGVGKIIDRQIGGALCINKIYDPEYIQYLQETLDPYSEALQASCVETIGAYVNMESRLRAGLPFHPFTREDILAHKSSLLQNHDFAAGYLHELTEQLLALEVETAIRMHNACLFQEILDSDGIEVIRHRPRATYWRQNILTRQNRDGLLEYLRSHSVKAGAYFPPINRFFTFQNDTVFPHTEAFYERVINLWPGVETTEEEIARIGKLIDKYFQCQDMSDQSEH